MRILVLAPHPFYIDRGTPMDVDILLRALSGSGHQVDALVFGGGEDRSYPNVRVIRTFRGRWPARIRPSLSAAKLFADFRFFLRAWKLVRRERYDVIHAGEEAVFMAMLFRRLHGVPYVYDMDSSLAQQLADQSAWFAPLRRIFERLEAAALSRSLAAAPVCNLLAELAQRRGAPHVQALYDISQLTGLEAGPSGLARQWVREGKRILMYVGNLEPYQGVDLLVASFAIALRRGVHAELVIAGGSPGDIRKYRAMAAREGAGESIHFIGPWPANDLGRLLAEADVLVAPRITGINTPLKVFPYLHSGRAVLVTDLPTHSQILDDSVAYLAAPNPEAFADAILRLVSEDELRQRLGEAGKQFVEREHTFPAHQRRVDQLYAYVADALASAAGATGGDRTPADESDVLQPSR